MYILTRLKPRANTTDTILYYAASDKSILEELLLSIYDEYIEILKEYGSTEEDKEKMKLFFEEFYIVKVSVIS